ncbi:GNAT family N-acetyltransferase [Pedobacter sp. GSP4]|uniref:GNAT family N-acetyltransferase n=1 Tax=Pedobacter sp. GSP4 TaxID=3453716 RepID=UPI003EED7215
MKHITIEQALPTNLSTLQEIAKTTFYEAFAGVNSKEDMQLYLDNNFAAEKLSGELNNKDAQFYFAMSDGQAIGYLKINLGQAQTENLDNNALEIERIYVLEAFHGQQVGQLLYQKAIDIAYQIQAPFVWLGVWEENHRALRFYQKNGFTAFDKHLFMLGNDEQTDLMMKKILLHTSDQKTA